MKKKNGFTLIEILAVIIILGVLMLIAVPAVTEYVTNSKSSTYQSYTEEMKGSAKNMMIDCIANNDTSCVVPDKGQSTIVFLSELIDKGYSDILKDPQGDGDCDSTRSYIKVTNNGSTGADYTYETCLYCSKYETKSTLCAKTSSDGDAPICGTVQGESTLWTNENRTISVGCTDKTSGCLRETFSRTFGATTKESIISIADKSGNTTNCPVKVYVDKEAPTCKLKMKSGTAAPGGWYGGDVKVEMYDMIDGSGSGVLTYGIGSSIKNRNYDKQTIFTLDNGITTVIGYVKDYAGNEGTCSLEVKVDLTPPTQDIALGYQIYPNKESYTVANMTESGTTFTSTTTDPIIAFSGLGNYKRVSKMVVHLNTGISSAISAQLFYSNDGTFSEANSVRVNVAAGSKIIELPLPITTYNYLRLDLGDLSGKAYNISRIDLIVNDTTSLYTNKNVTVYADAKDTISGVAKYSYDDGLNWTTNDFASFATNTTVKVKSMDVAGNVSVASTIVINNIDKLVPTCALVANGTVGDNGWFRSNAAISFSVASDPTSTTDYAMSGIKNYGIDSINGNKIVTLNTDISSKTYNGYIEDNAGNASNCSITVKRDASVPTCTLDNTGTIPGSTVVWSSRTDLTSGIASFGLSNTLSPTYNSNISYLLSSSGNYTIYGYVKDNAGNEIVCSKTVAISTPVAPGTTYNFDYTGNVQTFTVIGTGNYKIELWGASGGGHTNYRGKGAYTVGNIYLTAGTVLYVYVGQSTGNSTGGWNGGGNGVSSTGAGGGGATDIRLVSGTWSDIASLRSRIMVAGGGGGGASTSYGNSYAVYSASGGKGGLNGSAGGNINSLSGGAGGTQTTGNAFGKGGASTSDANASGGGGGYYGGYAATRPYGDFSGGGGAGGSSFVSGYASCNAINSSGTHTGQSVHYSGYSFTNVTITSGSRNGNGGATITFIN